MKNYLLILCLFFTVFNAKSQVNLVPNPSFETSTCCPQGWVYPWLFDGWDLNYNTADFFHSNDTANSQGIPINSYGNQCAVTGNSYAGFCSYSIQLQNDSTALNNREYIGGLLSQPLNIGTKYFVSFKVSMADYYSYCATNKLGVKFFTQDLTNGSGYTFILSLPPPFVNNISTLYTNDIISDTIGWHNFKGSFIADSIYSSFLIGNFFEVGSVDSLMLSSSNTTCRSYYFIDDVCVSTDSLYCEDLTHQVVQISADSSAISQNSCINFYLQTDVVYDSCQWAFENGMPQISTQFNPTFICYSNMGNHDVSFIGYKKGGCADTLTLEDYIHVDTLTATMNHSGTKKSPYINLKDNIVSVLNLNEPVDYKIVDVTGKTVAQGQFSSINTIDCNSFNAGIYILSLNQSDHHQFKFIINP